MIPIYTIEDLTPEGISSSDKPHYLAVIGNPIEHSRSPQMQQAALDAYGLPFSYIRVLAGLKKGEFEQTVRKLDELGFIGVNVTVPFKKRAFAMANKADDLAILCGAANTLKFSDDTWWAFNTDGPGFEHAIKELCGRPLGSYKTLILGACGGAGSALAAQCVLSDCPQLTLANRPRLELSDLALHLMNYIKKEKRRRQKAPRTDIRTVSMENVPALEAAVAEADLIVNATPLGLKEDDPVPIDPAWLRPGQIVYDIVPQDTYLSRAAAQRGCVASNGLSMLLWQGYHAFSKWFGAFPLSEPMRAALADKATEEPTA